MLYFRECLQGRENLVSQKKFKQREIIYKTFNKYNRSEKYKEKYSVSKAQRPDGFLNWIVKECNEQVADKIQVVIMCSINE